MCLPGADGDYLAYARLQGDTVPLRWDGKRFSGWQTLSGPGGREFAAFQESGVPCLLQLNFLTGSHERPSTCQRALLYRWSEGAMREVAGFDTNGATDACVMDVGDRRLVVVSESLSPEIHFRTDSHVYALGAADIPPRAP